MIENKMSNITFYIFSHTINMIVMTYIYFLIPTYYFENSILNHRLFSVLMNACIMASFTSTITIIKNLFTQRNKKSIEK